MGKKNDAVEAILSIIRYEVIMEKYDSQLDELVLLFMTMPLIFIAAILYVIMTIGELYNDLAGHDQSYWMGTSSNKKDNV